MTERIFCDDCQDYGYVYLERDNSNQITEFEVISTCKCPQFLMLGESK